MAPVGRQMAQAASEDFINPSPAVEHRYRGPREAAPPFAGFDLLRSPT